MHYTIDALLHGKEKVLEYYGHAKSKWSDLFAGKDGDVAAWSDWIAEQTADFEKECGGRLMAPEIMAWSAIGSLYSIQFGWREAERDQARKWVEAVEKGRSSAELKEAAHRAAAFYRLDDRDKLPSDAA